MQKLLVVLLVAVFIFLAGFSTTKPLTVTGEAQDWNNVLFCLEQSNSPHLQVVAARDFLLKQLTDTTKQKK
jgi:hypothetical protein